MKEDMMPIQQPFIRELRAQIEAEATRDVNATPEGAELLTRLEAVDWGDWLIVEAELVPNPDATRDLVEFDYRDRGIQDFIWMPDGASWQQMMSGWLRGNDSAIDHKTKNASGAVVRTFSTAIPQIEGRPMKLDRLNAAPSGNKIVYSVAVHEVSNAATRINAGLLLVTPDGTFNPYPVGQMPVGADVARELILGQSTPPPPAPPPEPTYTIEQLRAGIIGGVAGQTLFQQYGNHGFRVDMQQKMMDALVAAMDKNNTDPRAQAFQFLLMHFLWDRLYEVLRDNGLLDDPKNPARSAGEGPTQPVMDPAWLAAFRANNYETVEDDDDEHTLDLGEFGLETEPK